MHPKPISLDQFGAPRIDEHASLNLPDLTMGFFSVIGATIVNIYAYRNSSWQNELRRFHFGKDYAVIIERRQSNKAAAQVCSLITSRTPSRQPSRASCPFKKGDRRRQGRFNPRDEIVVPKLFEFLRNQME
jgi:hypothetical protein